MSLELDITCPSCDHKFKERASNMTPGATRACPGCGKIIGYTGDDLSNLDSNIKRAMDDVKRTFKGFGK